MVIKNRKSKPSRRRHSADFKVRVVVAALREDKTQSQLAAEFGIHPLQISAWKKQAVEVLPEVFGSKAARTASEQSEIERSLYEKIGRLETQLDWLKKKLGPLH